MVEEVKEFIKEPCFTKAIDFGDILSVSKIFGYADLIPIGGVPCQAVSYILRCLID
jgi:hypothetical protein